MIAAVGQGFFMFLMMRCSGYAQANRMRVKLLSSACRIWSSKMIMLSRSAWTSSKVTLCFE